MGIKFCPKCGGKVSLVRNDCIHCGYVFPTKKQCPDCEEMIDAELAECPVCGHPFNDVPPQKPVEEPKEAPIPVVAPVEEPQPVEEAAPVVQEQPAPIEEPALEETPVEETPVEGTPVEEPVAEPAPEEPQVEEQPAEESQPEEALVEVAPEQEEVVFVEETPVESEQEQIVCPYCGSKEAMYLGGLCICMTCKGKFMYDGEAPKVDNLLLASNDVSQPIAEQSIGEPGAIPEVGAAPAAVAAAPVMAAASSQPAPQQATSASVTETPLGSSSEVPPQAPVKKERAPRSGGGVFTYIVAGLALLAMLLTFIGIFGKIISIGGNTTIDTSADIGLSYFFKTGPEGLREVYKYSTRYDYYNYSLIMFIFDSVLFFGGAVACIAFMIISVIKNVKSLSKKAPVDLKFAFLAVSVRLPSILFLIARKSLKVNAYYIYKVTSSYGWGAVLTIIAFALIVLANLVQKASQVEKWDKHAAISTIINFCVTTAVVVMLFVAFSPLVKIEQYTGGYPIKAVGNGIYLAESALSSYSYGGGNLITSIVSNGVFSMIFSIIGLGAMFFAVFGILKNKKILAIDLLATAFALLLISTILSLSAAKDAYVFASNFRACFSGRVIVGIVFICLSIGGLITTHVMDKKHNI